MTYDVIIVGGGPAGSVAGLNLAGRGLHVALLDRAGFPRLKPCGGGISYRVYRRFPYLKPVLDSVPIHLVDRVVLESPSGDVVECSTDEPLYVMIRRWEFDHALLNACKSAGVEVRENCFVTGVKVESDSVALTSSAGQDMRAKLVIGADGVNSTIAIRTGLRQKWKPTSVAIDTSEETPSATLSMEPGTMYVYYGFGRSYGYGYAFPKAEHVNAGIGFLLQEFQRRGNRARREHENFMQYLKERGVIVGDSDVSNLHAYLLPLGGPLKKKVADRALLAGDAAGFVNGFTAEGIYYAMVSGELAGKAAAEACEKDNFSSRFLRRYDEACERELGVELKKAMEIQRKVLAHPGRIDRVVRLAHKDEKVRRLLTDYSVGRITYQQLRRGMASKALALLRQ